MLGAFGAGALAGLGVAMPLGAIGVLLLQEGVTRGWRPAAAGATGVAVVDLAYATAAVVAGGVVTRLLSGHERAVRLAGAVVLLALAARGLTRLRRPLPAAGDLPDGRVLTVFTRFVGLTAVNPLTALYFVVLATGLGATVAGPARGTAFVAGAFLASWAWQLLLAGAGASAGARMPDAVRTAVSALGYLVIAGYGVHLALS